MEIKKGQMITFAEGEYSDYCVNGLVVATSCFNLDTEKSEWIKQNCEERAPCRFRSKPLSRVKDGGISFLAHLNNKLLVDDVNYVEVHTGSYGDVDITYDDNT